MEFFNPAALIGLIAASIPLILHLIHLRKLKKVEFSSLRFLKELQKTRIRNLKIKRLLLLALRTLAIIFIVLAFARPTIESPFPFLNKYSNTSAVILVDNSPSMNLSDSRGNRFNRAKNIARNILATRREGDETAIIDLSGGSDFATASLLRNSGLVREHLDNMKIGYAPADLDRGLRSAANLLHSSNNLAKEIFIISDMQKNVFSSLRRDTTKFAIDISSFFMFPLGRDADNLNEANVSIDSVATVTKIYRNGSPVEAEVFLNNHSDKRIDEEIVSLYFNGRKTAQKRVTLLPNERKAVGFSAIPKNSGLNRAKVVLEHDALDEDNAAYFGFTVPQKPRVAIVSEAGRSRFLELALAGKLNGENLVTFDVISPSGLGSIDFNKYDMIICGSGALRSSDVERLKQYVSYGGGVFLFANSQTPADIMKRCLAELGFGPVADRQFSHDDPARFISIDRNHPIYKDVFKGLETDRQVVESPKITKAKTVSGGLGIITISGGNFLAESKYGEGKAIYCAVEPDGGDWSTFPYTGIFPITIFRTVAYLASGTGEGVSIKAGQSAVVTVPKKYSNYSGFKIIDPSGSASIISGLQLAGGTAVNFPPQALPGNYMITSPDGGPVAVVSVNSFGSESDFSTPKDKEIENFIRNISSNMANIEMIQDPRDLKTSLGAVRTGTELWKLFVVLTLICLIAEMLVAKNTKTESEED